MKSELNLAKMSNYHLPPQLLELSLYPIPISILLPRTTPKTFTSSPDGIFLKIIKRVALHCIRIGMPNKVGMERSFHSSWNGIVIPFRLEWKAHSIPIGIEWSHSILPGMEWSFHSSWIGMTIPFHWDWNYNNIALKDEFYLSISTKLWFVVSFKMSGWPFLYFLWFPMKQN